MRGSSSVWEDLSTPERNILIALGTLQYATNAQLCRYLYSPGSLTFVREATHTLVAKGLIARDRKQTKTSGNTDGVFSLSARGGALLARCGNGYPPLIPATRDASALFQKHVLGVTDLLVAARCFERTEPHRVVLIDAIHDAVLKRAPIPLSVDGRPLRFIPDAWLHLAVDGVPFPISIELDRGTEEERRWRAKVATLLAFARGPVMERFGVRNFTIAVPVCPDDMRLAEHRSRQLLRWTEREMAARAMEDWGHLFLVRPVDAAMVSPVDFFAALAWRSPFDDAAHRLIEGYDGADR